MTPVPPVAGTPPGRRQELLSELAAERHTAPTREHKPPPQEPDTPETIARRRAVLDQAFRSRNP